MGKHSVLAICMACMMGVDCTVYTIGGWMAGGESTFLKTWQPIFEQYLTASVGALSAPAANFSLVAADFQEQQSFAKMISDGQLDFVCKFSEIHVLKSCNFLFFDQTHLQES